MEEFDFKEKLFSIYAADRLADTLADSFEKMPTYEILVTALLKAIEKE